MSAPLQDIRNSRDKSLWSLGESAAALSVEIARNTNNNAYLLLLTKRYQDLMNERDTIARMATDQALASPDVIAAAASLNTISSDMETVAKQLPNATNILNDITKVLSLGQKFTNLIAK